MNRQRYRLVFSTSLGALVAVSESARGRGKAASGARRAGAVLATALLALPAFAQKLPTISPGVNLPAFVTYGQAGYQINGNQAFVNQVGNKAILNWQNFNIAPGYGVQFRQVDGLDTGNLVPGASFTTLNRIWDINPSVIYGSISQGEGQKGNIILVNANGIAFMGGSQVNLNSFTASTLNIADKFIVNGLLSDKQNAQYEKALDGSEARGFIKVFEGARISADSQGRVMLIAPTVVNRGSIEAPDGQVILAAGSRAFLRSDDSADLNLRGLLVEVDSPTGLSGFDTANTSVANGEIDGQVVNLQQPGEDLLGHATNFGQLSSARGNVTMVGLAVNQNGIARATSSVVANGSVYLMAKDTAPTPSALDVRVSKRGGQVILGAGSLTEVLPEVGDATTTVDGDTGTGVVQASQVRVLGQQVYVAGGATIKAPSGDVRLTAVDDPSLLSAGTGTLAGGVVPAAAARLHVASGAVIDVAGLSGVQVSAGRNTVAVELRGDELKDSPVNRTGPLRGEKDLSIDIEQALSNSDAGKDTLIARDSLLAYRARLERGIAERSTAGGTVMLDSQGQTVVENGVTVDLSGGSVAYQQATAKTTVLSANGKRVDLADAVAGTKYDAIVSRYVIDYGRWNEKEVIELPSAQRVVQAYTEGQDAGSLSINSKGATYMQASVVGKTVAGERQLFSGNLPRGAQVTLDARATQVEGAPMRNQALVVDRFAVNLPAGFGANAELPDDLKQTLSINADLLGKDRAAELALYTDQTAEVRAALRAPLGGGVDIQARDLTVKADIVAPSGTISLTAGVNATGSSLLRVDDGVRLDASGAWVNLLPGAAGAKAAASVDGGRIVLTALSPADAGTGEYQSQGTVSLGAGVSLDASGGALLDAKGQLKEGAGGSLTVSGYAVGGLAGTQLSAYGLSEGGTLNLTTREVGIADTAPAAPAAGSVHLDPRFFTQGGFAQYNITALERLEVADHTTVQPQVVNRELRADFKRQATGTSMAAITTPVLRNDQQREAASIALTASKKDADTGALRIGEGARVEVDAGGTIELEARTNLDIEGSLVARGGAITAELLRAAGDGYLNGENSNINLWLGKAALLDASGIAQTYTDARGLTQGEVLGGGTVNLVSSGTLVTQEGSRIDVSGAAPVRLDQRNEAGGIGRTLASDAGSVNLSFGSQLLLDGGMAAAGGSAAQRGGALSISTVAQTNFIDGQPGFDAVARDVVLQASVVPQAEGLTATDALAEVGSVIARIATDPLEAAGFDRMRVSSADGIVLADGLNLGAGRSLPLRELQLDAARIETQGNASLTADAIRLGNYLVETREKVGSEGSTDNVGVFTANARLLELAGNLRLQGMARSELTGTELVQLSAQSSATIETTADLTLRGGVIAPGSLADITLKAPGRDVRLESVGSTSLAPLSALGSVRIEAQNITQAGRLVAPLGQIELVAQGDLVLAPDSVTSVSAAPGQVLPLGQIQNGVDWLANSDTPLETLPDKSIRLTGGAVQLQAGSSVNVSGGGDLQAFEFTVGPGGSSDFLADAHTYAILPGFQGGFAPSDATVGATASVRTGANLADPLLSTGRAVGEAVYLSGVSGLPDGVYTLLPAHYALLPGAMAVRLDSSSTLLPGQAYTRQDGVRMAAGYLTDTRANAPRAGDWRAVEVLTQAQLRDRSEYTLSQASEFFAGTGTLPQDAGLLSLSTQSLVQLDGTLIGLAAAGGRGMAVDISAPNLVVASGSPEGMDPAATTVDVAKINALGAASVLLGATRTRTGNGTTLAVGASQLMLANEAQSPLAAPEVMLAATDILTLKAGSKIDAQGADGDAGVYRTEGDGAFVRAASSSATLVRSGTSGATGTLVGEAGSVVLAAKAIAMDASLDNAFAGQNLFVKDGQAVAGQLSLGASRINLGDPTGSVSGITFKQSDLNALLGLNTLALTSYAGFDIYGSVDVGGLDANGRPALQNLTLQGPGLAGLVDGDAENSANVNVRAVNLTLTNSGATAFNPAGTLGSGQLNVLADKLMLGTGEQKPENDSAPVKTIAGFASIHIEAGETIAAGTGSTEMKGVTTLATARLAGVNGAKQTLSAGSELLTVKQTAPAQPLAASTSLGAGWTLNAGVIHFDTQADLASGQLAMNAGTGDITLGANADLNVAGRDVAFFNVTRGTWGGTVALKSDNGSIHADPGSRFDVSGAAGADGGTLTASAVSGTVELQPAKLLGSNRADADGQQGEGARVRIDALTLDNASALNTAFNAGGFSGERTLRARSGDLNVAAGDSVSAQAVSLSADAGTVNVAGAVSASGAEGGQVGLYGQSVALASGGRIEVRATAAGADGGDVEIGASTGTIDLQAGSTIDVSAGAGGQGGTLHLRALRTGNDVAVTALDSSVLGARDVSLEAVRVYNNIGTLNATGASSGSTLSLASINSNDNTYAGNHAAIKARLGKTGDAGFHIISGTEVRSTGSMALGDGTAAKDWNLKDSAAGGEAGVLSLRAGGNLEIKSNLSDGFVNATPSVGQTPSALLSSSVRGGRSWSFNLVAGADTTSANVMATRDTGDLTVAAGKLVRTGAGDIRMAAGQDIKLASNTSAVYTAGRQADALPGFVSPISQQSAFFTQGGGDIEMTAGRNVSGVASTQLYSDWLYRQGRLSEDGATYASGANNSLAWWVRFDQFRQGVGALGGGDVTVRAGGSVSNLSGSAPTQGRMASSTPDASKLVKTGGGNVTVEAGADVLAGQYFADNGNVRIVAGGQVNSSPAAASRYTTLAVGDGQVGVQANGNINVATVLNPQLLDQVIGSPTGAIGNAEGRNNAATSVRRSYFSTYAADSGADLSSLGGNTSLLGANAGGTNTLLPPSLLMTAFSGDVTLESSMILTPAAHGQLELLAQNNVNLNLSAKGKLTLSDSDPTLIANALRPSFDPILASSPALTATAATPVHQGDATTAKVYAVQGDVTGPASQVSLDLAKAVEVRAGRDVNNLYLKVQNANPKDRTVVEAGRDMVYFSGTSRDDPNSISLGGLGGLEVSAARNINLGTSGGILSRGNLDNANLGAGGADIRVMAGVGPAGLDAQGTLERLAARVASGTVSDTDLWLVRWLSGNDGLSAAQAPGAVAAVVALDPTAQRDKVREMLFAALRQTGRDANLATSDYAGNFGRGYAALDLVFPGIGTQDANGNFANYEGGLNLFASRIKTERGGNIDIMVPGGGMVVGLANTPANLVNVGSNVLGVVASSTGDVRAFTRDDMLVNQSRILTVGGGDVLLWSSEGDIDAGKGKKTASAVPPPIISIDAQGNVTQELQGAASGSGIGALSTGGVTAGDVDLIAPKGTVNAGDAGIRAGNLNIAALVVLGADNITVTGTSAGTPVADTSAVTAASSGATAGGDDTGKVVEALNAAAADSAKAAQELAAALKPSVVRVEVLGYGE